MSTPRDLNETGKADWKKPSSPHGYDQPEFSPAQAPRDYRRSRTHAPDEERSRLRRLQQELDAPAAEASPSASAAWDTDAPTETNDTPSSRLYRD
ncbi:MAG: hypothetical protein B7X76_07490 [Azorhizobium sp. 39-67-5]|nr:MAG: hypothetical protein B7Y70_12015 [Rhizobiales bacterium 35-68-8]OZA83230.1 MAG: hypothetical protein B7X76_07490 [Azorhizobium sp. 39-67-5]